MSSAAKCSHSTHLSVRCRTQRNGRFGDAGPDPNFRLLKSVNSYQVEVLVTLAAVTGGYALASRLHVSGPLAMLVVGLTIGWVVRKAA